MIITLLGGSGFIGRALAAALERRGDTVRTVSLRDPLAAATTASGSDVVVNLAGAAVAERWTDAQKRAIMSTRVDLPKAFLAAVAGVANPPKAYVSASAIGYYGTSRTATFTETSAPGDDFLAEVCVAWEREAQQARALAMRVALVRTGIVLGTNGGALAKLLPLFRFGLGGVVASGEQWYSWIHLADQIGIYLLAIDGYTGVLNATAPNPVKNREFTQALAHAVHRPALFPAPEFALKLVFGEGAYVVTEGQRVLPEATLAAGYAFRFPDIGPALIDIAG
jgi:uncharacterized protein (TIGR01777 family)